MSQEVNVDFDLPEPPADVAKVKPRIHKSAGDESVCVSCEG